MTDDSKSGNGDGSNPKPDVAIKTTSDDATNRLWTYYISKSLARTAPSFYEFSFLSDLARIRFPKKTDEIKKTLEERKTALLKELAASGIDPVLFDVLLSNEMNRRLKVQFGVAFLVFTLFFTAVSYSIVVLDGVFKWGISPIAITALIIETPIQFIGLLYIIARNLFPYADSNLGLGPVKARSNNKDA